MSPVRLRMLCLLMAGGLWSAPASFAWQSPSAREPFDVDAFRSQAPADELVLQDKQDKAPAKPNEAAKPPARPQTPTTTPARPAPRPAVPPEPAPPQPQPPQPQFNPFVNPQPNQPFLARLSRAPDMFGDSFPSLTATVKTGGTAGNNTSILDLPLAGGGRRFKNEHSRALPTDRVFGTYHHFHNAVEANSLTPGFRSTDTNVDRFTVGFEKTFLEGNASVELRLPMSVPFTLSTPDALYRTDSVGDLAVTLKGLLYSDDSQAFAVGLVINTPTGADLQVSLPNSGAGAADFTLENDAAHLTPFLAYQAAPTENFFFNGFLQFDTPTNDNSVRVRDRTAATTENLKLTDQTLMYVDTSFGYWLFREPEAEFLTGLAGLLELHYTTALTSADVVSDSDQIITFGANTGSLDAINLTIGVHAEIARSTIIRAGYVTPLRSGNHRFFDSEFTIAVVFRR